MGQASSLELEFQAQPDRQAPTPNGSGQGPEEKTPEGRVFVVTGRGGPGEGAGLDAVGGASCRRNPTVVLSQVLWGFWSIVVTQNCYTFILKLGGGPRGEGSCKDRGWPLHHGRTALYLFMSTASSESCSLPHGIFSVKFSPAWARVLEAQRADGTTWGQLQERSHPTGRHQPPCGPASGAGVGLGRPGKRSRCSASVTQCPSPDPSSFCLPAVTPTQPPVQTQQGPWRPCKRTSTAPSRGPMSPPPRLLGLVCAHWSCPQLRLLNPPRAWLHLPGLVMCTQKHSALSFTPEFASFLF